MENPYRPFFLLGWCMGVFFFTLWPLFVFLQKGPNPIILHQHGIVNLVIGSFAIGFLLTAVPRFTGMPRASLVDVVVLLAVSTVEFFVLVTNHVILAEVLAAGKFFYVIQFALRRVRNAAQGAMPNTFWVLMGFAAAIVGNGVTAAVSHWPLMPGAEWLLATGKALCSRGFLTGIFIGIGSRLMPMLTGVKTFPLKVNRIFHPLHPWLALMFFTGLVMEYWQLRLALVFQSAAVTGEIIYLWRFWKLPMPGTRAVALWIASWLMVLGSVATLLWPDYRTDIFHIVFIGVFFAGTITVASHVLVSHEKHNPSLLTRFWPLGMVVALVMLAMVTRVSARITSYWEHLGYAGAIISIALLIWGVYFLRWRELDK